VFFEWKYHTSGFLGRETHETADGVDMHFLFTLFMLFRFDFYNAMSFCVEFLQNSSAWHVGGQSCQESGGEKVTMKASWEPSDALR
jgi:hypothetical protein